MPSLNLRQISRAKLYEVFKTEELVRLVEDILYAVNNTLPGAADSVQDNLDAHIADTGDAHQASAIGAAPGGSRASTTVQGQLGELDTAKLAGSAVSAFILTLLDDANAAAARSTLALGSMATQDANNVAITGGSVTTGSGPIGYSAGNGGTVTQLASKSTTVTLDERAGEITMDGANLVAGASVGFTLANSTIGDEDYVHIRQVGGTQHAYSLAWLEFNGGVTVNVKNITGADIAEALVLRFYVFKAATT